MKLKNYIFLLPFLILALVGCKDDDETASSLKFQKSFSLTLPLDINDGETLTFTTPDNWTIPGADNSLLSFSQTSGKSGANKITIKPRQYNCTNDTIRYSFTIASSNGNSSNDIDVELFQEPLFKIESLNYEADPAGETLHIRLKTKATIYPRSLQLYYNPDSDFDDMMDTWNSPFLAKEQSLFADGKMMRPATITTRARISDDEEEVTLVIKPNTTSRVLKGDFCFCIGDDTNMRSELMTVVQTSVNTYCSKDMVTGDSIVTQLQKHKIGNGVPVVILGDGFLDRDIASGKFREATNKAIDALFSMHPMTALRDYFDVYEVSAVSYNDYFTPTSSTAFNSKFTSPGSSEIRGDDNKAEGYAKLAIGDMRINDAVIIVLVNENQYGGTCSMRIFPKISDIPNGISIAYVPLYESDDPQRCFATILNHEVVGHGFAKLSDEYDTERLGKISSSEKQEYEEIQKFGFYRNIAFDSDVTKSYWANFAADSRYKSENLGCYEGGACFTLGVYRPTENSIMNANIGGFNVAGRVMIYKRCMNIAFGNRWKYNEADFIAFDLENKAKASTKRNAPAKRSGTFKPLAPPKLIMMPTAK